MSIKFTPCEIPAPKAKIIKERNPHPVLDSLLQFMKYDTPCCEVTGYEKPIMSQCASFRSGAYNHKLPVKTKKLGDKLYLINTAKIS